MAATFLVIGMAAATAGNRTARHLAVMLRLRRARRSWGDTDDNESVLLFDLDDIDFCRPRRCRLWL